MREDTRSGKRRRASNATCLGTTSHATLSFARRNRPPSILTWVTIGVFLLALAYVILKMARMFSPGRRRSKMAAASSVSTRSTVQGRWPRAAESSSASCAMTTTGQDTSDSSSGSSLGTRCSSATTSTWRPGSPTRRRATQVLFRGQYEWNTQGGILHWTHHDPSGRRPWGWLQHLGVTYR
jgi:hypothetical protein